MGSIFPPPLTENVHSLVNFFRDGLPKLTFMQATLNADCRLADLGNAVASRNIASENPWLLKGCMYIMYAIV